MMSGFNSPTKWQLILFPSFPTFRQIACLHSEITAAKFMVRAHGVAAFFQDAFIIFLQCNTNKRSHVITYIIEVPWKVEFTLKHVSSLNFSWWIAAVGKSAKLVKTRLAMDLHQNQSTEHFKCFFFAGPNYPWIRGFGFCLPEWAERYRRCSQRLQQNDGFRRTLNTIGV